MEVLSLPKDLPDFIEVDMADIQVGDIVHLSDLKLPEGVTSTALALGEDRDMGVASVLGTSWWQRMLVQRTTPKKNLLTTQLAKTPATRAPTVKPSIRLIVGLGNPGEKYIGTRHNAGADFVQTLANSTLSNSKLTKRWPADWGAVS